MKELSLASRRSSGREQGVACVASFLQPFTDYYVSDAFGVRHRSHASVVRPAAKKLQMNIFLSDIFPDILVILVIKIKKCTSDQKVSLFPQKRPFFSGAETFRILAIGSPDMNIFLSDTFPDSLVILVIKIKKCTSDQKVSLFPLKRASFSGTKTFRLLAIGSPETNEALVSKCCRSCPSAFDRVQVLSSVSKRF